MYNGGTQCVKVAHRKHGMCRTNVWINDEAGLQIAKNIAAFTNVPLGDGPGWSLFSMDGSLMDPVSTVPFRLYHQMVQH